MLKFIRPVAVGVALLATTLASHATLIDFNAVGQAAPSGGTPLGNAFFAPLGLNVTGSLSAFATPQGLEGPNTGTGVAFSTDVLTFTAQDGRYFTELGLDLLPDSSSPTRLQLTIFAVDATTPAVTFSFAANGTDWINIGALPTGGTTRYNKFIFSNADGVSGVNVLFDNLSLNLSDPPPVPTVPEPGSLALLGLALAGALTASRRRR